MNFKNACHIYHLAEVKLNKIMSIKLNCSGHPYPINKARKPYCTKRTAPFQKRTEPCTGVVALFRVFTVGSVNKLIFTM